MQQNQVQSNIIGSLETKLGSLDEIIALKTSDNRIIDGIIKLASEPIEEKIYSQVRIQCLKSNLDA